MAVFVLFLGVMAAVAQSFTRETPVPGMQAGSAPADSKDCTPPDWAVSIGHAEMWKLHHNCK